MKIETLGDAFKSREEARKTIEEGEKIIYKKARHFIHQVLRIAEKEHFLGLGSYSITKRINQTYQTRFEEPDLRKVLEDMFKSREIDASDMHYRFGTKIDTFKP